MIQKLEADVLVAGGGLSGVCAALAAARNGVSVILVQDRSRLGGNSSSEIRMHVCGANHTTELLPWRETGIIEELRLTNFATNPQHSFEVWDLILYDKVISEKNITLMLDTAVVDAKLVADQIVAVKQRSRRPGQVAITEEQWFQKRQCKPQKSSGHLWIRSGFVGGQLVGNMEQNHTWNIRPDLLIEAVERAPIWPAHLRVLENWKILTSDDGVDEVDFTASTVKSLQPSDCEG